MLPISSILAKRAVRKSSRASRRGAVFVEGVIVISMLTLGLLGLVFFHDLYVKHLTASRLARASVLAHSMTGCGDLTPRRWIGTPDLGLLEAGNPNARDEDASDVEAPGSSSSDNDKASSILSKIGGTTGDGKGVINPIVASDVAGRASVQTRSSDILAQPRRFFETDVRARAHVSCAEPVRDGDFGAALEYIMDIF